MKMSEADIKKLLGLWEYTICEIRGEIKAQGTSSLDYAKGLCDKLENSMVAFAKGNIENTQFDITDSMTEFKKDTEEEIAKLTAERDEYKQKYEAIKLDKLKQYSQWIEENQIGLTNQITSLKNDNEELKYLCYESDNIEEILNLRKQLYKAIDLLKRLFMNDYPSTSLEECRKTNLEVSQFIDECNKLRGIKND